MKRLILRFNQSNQNSKKSFEAINDGTKTIETRAATIKYKNLKKGDMLVFVCGKSKIKKEAKQVRYFKSVVALLRAYSFKKITPFVKTKQECVATYESYPAYKEKIDQFGVVAIELK